MAKPTVSNYLMWIGAAVVIVIVFWAGCKCERSRNPIATSRIDTFVKKDSFYKSYPYPIPYEVKVPVPGKPYPVIEWEHDTLPRIVITETVDTPKILSRFFETKFYKTSTELKNGFVISYDTVSQNMITGKGVKGELYDTSFKITVDNTEPKRATLYLGASAFGNRYNLVKGFGADLSLKTPNGMMYSAGVKYLSDTILIKRGNLYYEAQVKMPLLNLYKRRNK